MSNNEDGPTRLHPSLTRGDDSDAIDKTAVFNRGKVGETRLKPAGIAEDKTRVAPQKKTAAKTITDNEKQTRIAGKKSRASSVAQASFVIKPGFLLRNRFRLQEEIGRGGMGVVYTARDLRKEEVGDQDSLIAIKFLSEDFKQFPDSLRMLQQETRKAQELAHPNIITVYDFDRDKQNVYMTMEYLQGAPLDDFLDEREHEPFDMDEALPIIEGIVKGLAYAHQKGVIHSDLKPGNIFLTNEGVAKIVDFGIARAVKAGEAVSESTLDQQSVFALTPGYASLEMFEGVAPDPKDDLYALACICYKLLSGKHPYNNVPANEAYQRGLEPEPVEGLNDRQWQTLRKGLALESKDRIGSAEVFLEGFLPPKKEPWKYAAAAIALITVVLTVYFLLRLPPEAELTEAERVVVAEQILVAKESMEVGAIAIAFENYKMILALPPYNKNPPGQAFVQQPYNRAAMQGVSELLDLFEAEARAAIESGYPADAEGFIDAGMSIPSAKQRFEKLQNQLISR